MTKATFQVVFDGDGLGDSEIEIKELMPALVALDNLFCQADELLNGGQTEHSLRVKGSFKTGSFKIDFVSFSSLIDKIKGSFSFDEVSNIVTAFDLVGYIIGGGGSLFCVLKFLQGRKPTKIYENEDGTFSIYKGDKFIKAEKAVIELYKNYKIRKAVEQAVSPLSNKGIDRIAFTTDDGQSFETIISTEKDFFTSPEEDKKQIDVSIYEIYLSIVKISFKEGQKWSLTDGETSYSVLIEDETFVKKVQASDVGFAKSDMIKLRMRREQFQTLAGVATSYYVEKIIEHIRSPKQIALPLDKG